MRLSIILIHYHAAELALEAREALDGDAFGSGLEVEWLVVDNGSTAEERELLRRIPGRILQPGENLGYAGGVNLGVAKSRGEVLVVMNPDVMLRPGCLLALVDALRSGAQVAGPKFFWDPTEHFLLPPTEERGRWPELRAVLAGRSSLAAGSALRAWRRHARRLWAATEPVPSFELSGALLATTRDVWEDIGPFDSGYPLYFEETDWLLRLRRRGFRALFVPQAEAVHLYAQSSRREPKAEAWFQQSSRRFRRRHYGPAFTHLLEILARPESQTREVETTTLENLALPSLKGARWLEWSASPLGFPAAACPLDGNTDGGRAAILAAADLAPPGRYTLRWTGDQGEELARRAILL